MPSEPGVDGRSARGTSPAPRWPPRYAWDGSSSRRAEDAVDPPAGVEGRGRPARRMAAPEADGAARALAACAAGGRSPGRSRIRRNSALLSRAPVSIGCRRWPRWPPRYGTGRQRSNPDQKQRGLSGVARRKAGGSDLVVVDDVEAAVELDDVAVIVHPPWCQRFGRSKVSWTRRAISSFCSGLRVRMLSRPRETLW